jgi:hypothetical protein
MDNAEPHELPDVYVTVRPRHQASSPALLIRRAVGLTEHLIGRRATFLMTSYTPEGEWRAYGWKDGLRIVSEVLPRGTGLDEPAVWI